uniref:Uncharacterized protein n=1 Tax=Phlebotomus papatasi TaxID=29031 RepID=A0A1B0DMS2_PHLPP
MKANLKGFSVKHRVFLVKNYYQFTGDFLCVKTKYEDNYRDSENIPEFSYDALMEIVNLFERTGSVMECPAKPPESSNQQIERIFVKEENPLGMIEEQDSLKTNPKSQVTHNRETDTDDEDDMGWIDEEDYFSPQRNESGSGAKLKIPMKKSKPNTQFPLNKEAKKQLLSNSNINWIPHTSNSLPDMGNPEESFQGQGQDSIKEDAVLFSLDPSYDKKLDGISSKIDKVLRLLQANVYRTSTFIPTILDG